MNKLKGRKQISLIYDNEIQCLIKQYEIQCLIKQYEVVKDRKLIIHLNIT